MTPTSREQTNTPSGVQWVIAHGYQQAVITEVGATLRSYRVGERSILAGFGPHEWAKDSQGQILAPWPDRIGDGRYEFRGTAAHVAMDEPEKGNAIHGLVRWRPFVVETQAQNLLAATCRLLPQPDFPFSLELTVEYRLRRDGLIITTRAKNIGDQVCPFALGFHPYLGVSDGLVNTTSLRLPAEERLVLDQRGLPAGPNAPVAGTEFDFRQSRAIGPARLDTVFTGFERDEQGFAWAAFEEPATGQGVDLWMDSNFRYVRCSTGDNRDADTRRRSLAFVPMSAPPDAFRSDTDLFALEPGAQWVGSWGIQPR
jgi:aldose 1-epimerase